MKEIKFTTHYEPTLSFADPNFKKKYEKRIGDRSKYIQTMNGEKKYLAICPRCNNPVAILGIYKKIDVSPHARHAKGISIPGVAEYNEAKYEHCPYHVKNANYVKEYVPEAERPLRKELYRIAKENFDKAIYLIEKTTGIHITFAMAEALAKNYVDMGVYNYIDATDTNIPWYLMYGHNGFPLHQLIIRKGTILYKELKKLGLRLLNSKIEGCVYVGDNKGYLLEAVGYKYHLDKSDHLKEELIFSVLRPDPTVKETLLYESMLPGNRDISIPVDSEYFRSLIHYKNWKPNQKLLDIAEKYMHP